MQPYKRPRNAWTFLTVPGEANVGYEATLRAMPKHRTREVQVEKRGFGRTKRSTITVAKHGGRT